MTHSSRTLKARHFDISRVVFKMLYEVRTLYGFLEAATKWLSHQYALESEVTLQSNESTGTKQHERALNE